MHRLIPLKSFSTITDNTKYSNTNRTRSFSCSSPSNLRPSRGRIRKNSLKIYSTVYPLSFHTRTSTSLPRRRYDISLESSRCQWPGICISPENTRRGGGRGDREDGWCAERGGRWVKKRGGWNVPPPRPLFSPLLSTVGKKGLEGEKFRRAQLFNRPYWPEWYPWVCGASTNS